jgi:hypothetical protein
MWAEQNAQKPWLLLRLAARQPLGLSFQDPPRSTQDTFQAAPQAETCPASMAARGGKGKSRAPLARRLVNSGGRKAVPT